MTRNQLLKKIKFSPDDFADIESAVKNAEKKTQGEIAVALTAESASYALWEVMASLFTSLVLFCCMIPLSDQIYAWLGTKFWDLQPWYLSAFFVIVCTIVTILLYILYNIQFIDRIVIPFGAKHAAVTNRAMRWFAESGVYSTEKNCGVLIFVSYFEREVRIVADKGISSKISNDLWNLIADEMTENLSKGNLKEAYIDAIEKCGNLLAENFPVDQKSAMNKKDELYNGLVVLEEERWV